MSMIIRYINAFVLIFKYGWPFMILLALFIAKFKWKKWTLDVVIIEKRGKNLVKTNDRGTAYRDKFTGLNGTRFLKSKDTMPVLNYKWILHNNFKPTNILEKLVSILRPTQGTLFVFKYGAKQYKPLSLDYNEEADVKWQEIKNANGESVFIPVFQQFDPRGYLEAIKFKVVDWDNVNFFIQEMRVSQERRRKRGNWLKEMIVPLAIIGAAIVISIIMIKYGNDYGLQLASRQPTPTNPEPIIENPVDAVIPGK